LPLNFIAAKTRFTYIFPILLQDIADIIQHWYEEHRRKLWNQAKRALPILKKDDLREKQTASASKTLFVTAGIRKKQPKWLFINKRRALLARKDRAERELKRIPEQQKQLRLLQEEWNLELSYVDEALEDGAMDELEDWSWGWINCSGVNTAGDMVVGLRD
jgi:hypothetical protein